MDVRDDLWNPCPEDLWCGHYGSSAVARASATIVNKFLPNYFDESMGGFVLSWEALQPLEESIRCAWSYDAGTMGGGDGCRGDQCVGDPSGPLQYCWWNSTQLWEMLEHHYFLHSSGTSLMNCGFTDESLGPDRCNYNEIILDAAFWVRALPGLIEAVYFPAGSARGEAAARRVHAAFVASHSDLITPLVRYDRTASGSEWTLVHDV